MKLKQLSVFLENKPGQLTIPCKALADADINITTLSLADTHQFGILRLLIREHERAKKVLEEAGCVVNITEVVAIDVPDRPGGLAEVLEVIEAGGINLEYMYAFTYRKRNEALMIFRFENPDAAVELLQNKGFKVVGGEELSRRVDE